MAARWDCNSINDATIPPLAHISIPPSGSRDGFGVVAGEFGVTSVGVITAGSAGSTFSFINPTFTKIGQISVVNNEGQDGTAGISPGYPTILSSQNSIAKAAINIIKYFFISRN